MEKLNVCLLNDSFPPAIDGVGGVMLNYCRELNRRGHRSLYIAPANKIAEPPADVELHLYRSMKLPFVDYHVGAPQIQPDFRKELSEIPFDLVHAHTPFLAGDMAKRVAKEKHIPLIATFHSKYYDDAYRATHSKMVSRFVVASDVDEADLFSPPFEPCEHPTSSPASAVENVRNPLLVAILPLMCSSLRRCVSRR